MFCSGICRTLRRLIRNREGAIAPMVAIMFPLLIGSAALAVDVTEWTLTKRQLQQATDSAAIAGVYSLLQSSDVEQGVDDDLSRVASLNPARSVEIIHPVAGREDDPYAVSVRVTVPLTLAFSRLFLSHSPLVTATASATVVETGQYCAFAIGPDSSDGLLIRADSVVEGDCGIASNASSSDAMKIEKGATVAVKSLASYGGIDRGDAGAEPLRHGLRQNDPYEDTEPPLVPTTGCPNMTQNADAHRTLVIEPGCYGNLVLNGTVRLQDGEYILNRGSLIIGPTANVSCNACTIFLTSDDPEGQPGSIGSVKIDQNATVNLSAPSQGPDAGIVIYQDRHVAGGDNENFIGGSGSSKINGLVYTPSESLHLDATWAPDVSCARFIGSRLILEGHIYIASSCPGGQQVNFRGTDVKLIG